jgi:hypothetical protein
VDLSIAKSLACAVSWQQQWQTEAIRVKYEYQNI